MKHRRSFALLAALTLAACGRDRAPTDVGPPPPVPVPLRDVVVSRLPSPYYHFEYDSAGRVAFASFASEFRRYYVTYDHGRIAELHDSTAGGRDHIVYAYDASGRVGTVRYVDPSGHVYTRVRLSYEGPRLVGLERERLIAGAFVVDKQLSLSYYPDGNLLELVDHRPAIDGLQPATTTIDRFEQYDDGANVDAFDLLHGDFFDHLVLLPGVRLQLGNPHRQVRTGDADNFEVVSTYDYDDRHRPRARIGTLTFTTGPSAGRVFPLRSDFTYY